MLCVKNPLHFVVAGLFAVGVGFSVVAYGADPPPPAGEASTQSAEENQAIILDEDPSMPPPILGRPDPQGPPRFGPPSRRDHRMFGKHHLRPSYKNLPEDLKLRFEEFLQKHFPDEFKELCRLDEVAPEKFLRKVDRMLPQMLRLMRMEHEDPETFSLRVEEVRICSQIRALARHIRRDRHEERDETLVAELRRLLERRFDARQEMHGIEIARLERRLADARQQLNKLAADKDKIVADELEETLASERPGPQKRRPHRMRFGQESPRTPG
ncbi:MAG: hypothetical protein KAV82_08245 [Phycisphaerae bacterium]|nr:hypothetical protein [Phycisphaerae bacterium]